MVSVKYDKDAEAFYIKLRDGKVFRTLSIGNDQFLDIDQFGKVIGMEFLNSPNKKVEEFEEVLCRTEEIEITV
jgi:uncharacterized protein YuzE